MNDLHFWHSYGLTASTNLDITDNNSFWKLLCFTVFQYKSIRDQIWPFRKIGQGQPSVFIWINLVVLQQPMLHTNFQCYRAFGSGGDFLRFLAHLSWRLTSWAYRMGLEPASVRPSVRASVCPCVHTFKHEYLRDQQADYNQILSEASLGWGKGCIRFWCRLDQNSGFHGNG